ncbi:MAG: AAA family ATPase, partial [Planctomycetes bacterium]|nr:AAA family ATPase [Planctomycetota bacterium]
LKGRSFVSLEDVRAVAKPVLRHRLQAGYEAEAMGMAPDAIIDKLLSVVSLPKAEMEKDAAVAGAVGSR